VASGALPLRIPIPGGLETSISARSKQCFLVFTCTERKIRCRCGYRGVEKLDFVDKYSPYAKRFEDYVSMLCAKMTLTDAASVAEIDWKAAKRIEKKYLSQFVLGLDELNPTRLGIDEVAYEKGHSYLTVVRDIDHGKVIWVGQMRKKETLDAFFTELGAEKSVRSGFRSRRCSSLLSMTCLRF
jgi:transposase